MADPIAILASRLSKLPGIGSKTATRLAYAISRMPSEGAFALADAIRSVKQTVGFCEKCQDLCSGSLCTVCDDEQRDDSVICVVARPQDLKAIEATGEFRGRYHVLHGVLNPSSGIGPEELKVKELLRRLQSEPVTEVILATNPNVEGEATATYLSRLIKPAGIKTSRITTGIAVGSELEYSDRRSIAKALQYRREV